MAPHVVCISALHIGRKMCLRVDHWAIAEAVLNQPHITPPPTPHCRLDFKSLEFFIDSGCGLILLRFIARWRRFASKTSQRASFVYRMPAYQPIPSHQMGRYPRGIRFSIGGPPLEHSQNRVNFDHLLGSASREFPGEVQHGRRLTTLGEKSWLDVGFELGTCPVTLKCFRDSYR